MPVISMFYGVIIYLYYQDNNNIIALIFMSVIKNMKPCFLSLKGIF